MANTENVNIIDNISADTIEPGDQIIVDGDLFIVRTVDSDREDIDEVRVTGENLTNPDEDTLDLFADDYFDTWAV